MKLRRAAVSAIVALTLSIAASLTGCGKQPQLVEVTHQVVLIFDVSGSTKPLASGWAARADRYAKQLKDGTRVLVAVADGASGSSLCIPRRVQLQGQGKDATQVQDSLTAQRNALNKVIVEQIHCGEQNPTDGSDLIGSLLVADNGLKTGMDSTEVLLFSDGMQNSTDLAFTDKMLADPKAVTNAITTLDKKDLLPVHYSGAELCITDPGVGGQLTAQQHQGVIKFWSSYAKKARADYACELL